MARIEKSEIAKTILKTIAAGGIMAMVMVAPNAARLLPLLGKDFDPKRFQRGFNYLRRKKFIKTYYKNNKEFVEITEQGEKRILSFDFEELKVKKAKRWDGMFRVIVFDIPEKQKKIRKLFRYKLEDMGLHPLQDSVMITPYDCKEEVDFLRGYLFIDDHVRYMVIKNIDDREELEELFEL